MSEKRRKPALEEALQDHHHLLEIEARLAGRFADGSCPAFSSWIIDVRKDLAELFALLEVHFAHEEQDGLHEEIAEALPNASHRLKRLLDEHAALLGKAASLRDTAAQLVRPGSDGPLRAEASEFFASLDQHERSERELFLLALEGEGGSPD